MTSQRLTPGTASPWFKAYSSINPQFRFHTVAGKSSVLIFLENQMHLNNNNVKYLFDIEMITKSLKAQLFIVINQEISNTSIEIQQLIPDSVIFYDADFSINKLFGVEFNHSDGKGSSCFILDQRLTISAVFSFQPEHQLSLVRIRSELAALEQETSVVALQAPVLVLPRIFEPQLCQALIQQYQQHGGELSGFMREHQGKTVLMQDPRHKIRCDHNLTDAKLIQLCLQRIRQNLLPHVQRAFQFQATRIERYLVACYNSSQGGHFRPHRDNTTPGTAHRRFAVSLNLNTGDYAGGALRFPEYGKRLYQAPTGGAVVFSCSLLHEATPVTRGDRYVFLPFLYDEAAAHIRQKNAASLQI